MTKRTDKDFVLNQTLTLNAPPTPYKHELIRPSPTPSIFTNKKKGIVLRIKNNMLRSSIFHKKGHLMRILLIALFLFTLPLPASAQIEDPILSMPDGQVILNISATERREVEQDLLVATLNYTATNKNSRELQNEINKAMAKALDVVKKEKSVKVNTGSYQVYETTEPRTKEKKWRGSQSLTIKSKDAETVLELAGKLQDMKLNMNGLNYTLSPETAIEVQDSLMEDALKQLQTRANRAAKAMGKSTAELRDVNVQGGGIPYRPRIQSRGAMMMESADMAMAAPVAASGESTITLSVSARALLKP